MNAPSRILPSAEPNVTPMIDVLLVLLIVFMLAVVRVHRTMDVQLPQPCGTACDAAGDAIVLEVLPGPSYRLNRTDVLPGELRDRLTAVYAGRPNKTILVAGARSCPIRCGHVGHGHREISRRYSHWNFAASQSAIVAPS
jgi:biopolymer transport protein ExbD